MCRKMERELDNSLAEEESFWRQRFRVEWMKEGDCNTKFFHVKASTRRSCNMIRGLYDRGGVWRTKDEDLEDIINEYFASLFSSTYPSSVDLEDVFGIVENRLPANLNAFFNGQFTADDIRKAIFQMNSLKALGSDGYPADFYEKF
ncbi:hypothetical protein Ddye_004392 [Dipteronia dyeriana]|uniref:Reverse transcriptase n=1 Tax=Dipteronia dyeriana TaxID=168575 RepID=A0AAE0CXC3_9ROSI|nr:hypothetical protein Ddye_004392 [Dipteronia dyeriana]